MEKEFWVRAIGESSRTATNLVTSNLVGYFTSRYDQKVDITTSSTTLSIKERDGSRKADVRLSYESDDLPGHTIHVYLHDDKLPRDDIETMVNRTAGNPWALYHTPFEEN